VEITPKTLLSVYAIGRPEDNSMDVIVHQLPVSQRGSVSPDDIETGSAGLVAGVPVAGVADQAAPAPSRPDALSPLSLTIGGLAVLALALMTAQVAIVERARARATAGGRRDAT
jgi:hypothetical protein